MEQYHHYIDLELVAWAHEIAALYLPRRGSRWCHSWSVSGSTYIERVTCNERLPTQGETEVLHHRCSSRDDESAKPARAVTMLALERQVVLF